MNSFTVNEKENSKLKPAQEDMVWFMVPHGKYAFTNPVQLRYFFPTKEEQILLINFKIMPSVYVYDQKSGYENRSGTNVVRDPYSNPVLALRLIFHFRIQIKLWRGGRDPDPGLALLK